MNNEGWQVGIITGSVNYDPVLFPDIEREENGEYKCEDEG